MQYSVFKIQIFKNVRSQRPGDAVHCLQNEKKKHQIFAVHSFFMERKTGYKKPSAETPNDLRNFGAELGMT